MQSKRAERKGGRKKRTREREGQTRALTVCGQEKAGGGGGKGELVRVLLRSAAGAIKIEGAEKGDSARQYGGLRQTL